MRNTLEIDGSLGEGGGQILRTSLTLSMLTGRPFRIVNIRANRPQPGLRPQHLQAARASAEICGAKIEGDVAGSVSLFFSPGKVRPGVYRFDIGTAGSTSLVLQTVFHPLALAEAASSVTITGGTHVPWSPAFHYLKLQWLPFMQRMGFNAFLNLKSAGFYPRGGGEISCEILPAEGPLKPLSLTDRGRLTGVRIISSVGNLPMHIAERQRDRAEKRMTEIAGKYACGDTPPRVSPEIVPLPSSGMGTMLMVLAEFERSSACFTSLGRQGKPAERVADEACGEFEAFMAGQGAVDEHFADQLVVPCALCPGKSVFTAPSATSHLTTNAETARLFGIEAGMSTAGDSAACRVGVHGRQAGQ
jgi:RNA 3'-terminal phosphate cyclase (ATP)